MLFFVIIVYYINRICITIYDEVRTIHAAGSHLLSIKKRTGRDVYNILRLYGFIQRYHYGYAYSTCIETLQYLNPNLYEKMLYYKSHKDIDFSSDPDTQEMVADIRRNTDIMLKQITPSHFTKSSNNLLEERRQLIDNIFLEAVSAMLIPYLNREKGQRYPLKRTEISN